MPWLQRRADGEDSPAQAAVVAPPDKAAGEEIDGPTGTRLLALESRVAVAEKSTRALLVEVVRLQGALSTAMKSVDEEKTALRENRSRAAAEPPTRVEAWLEPEKQQRRKNNRAGKNPLATSQDTEVAASVRKEPVKRAEQRDTRYQISSIQHDQFYYSDGPMYLISSVYVVLTIDININIVSFSIENSKFRHMYLQYTVNSASEAIAPRRSTNRVLLLLLLL